MKRYLLLLMLCAWAIPSLAQSHQKIYIETYAPIAVEEMYRSGVPASITLAQGLLESGAGRSTLASKSNNHFGIKCHNSWQGKKVYHDDDAKGECFRKYDNPYDSYRDHSDFLRYNSRYRFLFDYKITDYKAWAFGLKKAGYATDPSYAQKLIGIIENYALYEYDTKERSFAATVSVDAPSQQQQAEVSQEVKGQKKGRAGKSKKGSKAKNEIPTPPSQIESAKLLTERKRGSFQFALTREAYSQNGVPFIYSVEGETYKSIASANGLFLKELLKFNDLKTEQELKPGTVVYLQRKKNRAAEGLEMHVFQEGEKLWDVAQKYAVRMSVLYKLNGLKKEDVIKAGDIIKLRK